MVTNSLRAVLITWSILFFFHKSRGIFLLVPFTYSFNDHSSIFRIVMVSFSVLFISSFFVLFIVYLVTDFDFVFVLVSLFFMVSPSNNWIASIFCISFLQYLFLVLLVVVFIVRFQEIFVKRKVFSVNHGMYCEK